MGSAAALAGRRVLELAGASGAYCGKLLADLGADVIKIEPPGGDATRHIPPFWGDRPDPDRGLFFLYMNTNKRSVTLDLTDPAERARLMRLAHGADIFIEAFPPGHLDSLGLGYATLADSNPCLVYTSITGFGQTGPARGRATADIVANALGGAMYVTGDEHDPPVVLAGSQAYISAALFAAVSSLIALRHAARTGQGQHIDISIEEAVASVAHICGAGKWLDDHIIPRRWGTGLFASVPSGTYPCTDGLIYLMVNRPLHWKALAQWIHEVTGNAAVCEPLFEGPSSNRQPHRDLLDLYITELTTRHRVEQMYREGQRRHLAFTPVNPAAAVAKDPHLAARRYFVDVEHPGRGTLRYPGAPYRHAATPWAITRPAPRAGEHTAEVLDAAAEAAALPDPQAQRQPSPAIGAPPVQALAGLRVVEFTAGMAGPWVGRFMAYCGADVIKVESTRHPDVTRLYVPPNAPEAGIQPQLSPWFTDWNAGKRFIALDLTRPAAVDLVRRLVAQSDVVVENYSTGVMDKLGLGYAALRQVRPDVIMLSSTGYGDSGPDRHYVTWGPNIEALSGLSTLSGFPERPCTITQYAYPDALGALHGLVAVLSALDHRLRTGQGQYINLSQLEATVSAIGHVMMQHLATGREPQRLGNRSRHAAPHGCYPCKGEDRWCAIAVSSDVEWERLCHVLGRAEWIADARFRTLAARLEHGEELDRLIGQWTAARADYEVMHTLQEAGIAAGVVQNVEDQMLRDRQLAARRFFEEIEHVKKGSVIATGIPLGLTATPGRTGRAGAAVGQDTDSVFGDLLGLTGEDIRQYIADGVIEVAGRS